MLWTNGSATRISDGANHVEVKSLYVSGDDVYITGTETIIVGTETIYDRAFATLWKNGTPTRLGPATVVSADSVFVVGDDVYVAGTETISKRNVATLWKNGAPIRLVNNANFSFAKSVFVSGNDVYVAGYEDFPKGDKYGGWNSVATLWKNGAPTRLGNLATRSDANLVFVSGEDVYAAGWDEGSPALWKNGTAARPNFTVKSLFVTDRKVYVATEDGRSESGKNAATLLVNDKATQLSNPENDGYAQSVFVSGKDVYVAGFERISDCPVAFVWKNGNPIQLSDPPMPTWAKFVFVK
jgi:hypothetical protein